MFWILRRTGAANFFTSINNNYSSKSYANNNNNYDRNKQRPPRKAYGRLSVDSDENCNRTTSNSNRPKYNNPFDELDNFDILDDSANCSSNNNCTNSTSQEPNDNDSDIELDTASSKSNGNANERNESTINRLQAMVISDDDDYDESLTCNVCDRAFHCHRQLASHQQKKRHFGCSSCDTLFPSLMLLEHHKEEFEHWSDVDDDDRPPCCRRNREEYTDTDSFTSEAESEDLERLFMESLGHGRNVSAAHVEGRLDSQ